MDLRAWTILLALSTVWSTSFYLQAIALKHDLSVLNVVFWRVLIGGLGLWGFCAWRGLRLNWRKRWWAYTLLGATGNTLPFSLIVFGQQYIDSGSTAMFNTSPPFFAIVLAHFFSQDESFVWRKLVGIILGALGVAALFQLGSQPSNVASNAPHEDSAKALLGGAAVLLAGLLYAVNGVYGKKFNADVPITLGAGMLLVAAGLTAVLMLVTQTPFQLPKDLPAWSAILGLGLFCASLAYVMYFALLQRVGAVNTVLVTLLVPIGANILGVWLLQETFGVSKYLSMLLILLGLVVVDGRIFAWFKWGKST